MARFSFLVHVELRREYGKFASRQELSDMLIEQIEQAAGEGASGVGADGDSEYVTEDVTVEEYSPPKPSRSSR